MTLKEALDMATICGGGDLLAIKLYAEQDELLPKVTDLLMDIVQLNTRRMSQNLDTIKGYLYSPCSYYYQNYELECAANLDYLTRKMQLGYVFDENDKEIMKNIKLKESGPFWHDLAEAIKSVQDESYKPKYYNKY